MSDPAETPKRLYRKAAWGRDEATLPIVFGGVTLFVGIVVGVLVAIGLLIYYVLV
jgi:hypothetical protein